MRCAPRHLYGPALASACASICLLLPVFAFCQVQVLTEHNNVSRSGANTIETLLTTANVNFNGFGKLFTQTEDGYIVGQPLYLSAVEFPDGSTHNVVYVATQHDSVFAFDADRNQAPLWSVSFINPAAGITTVPMSDFGCGGTDFTEIGIVSTPVIDPLAGTLYVVAKTLENGAYIFRLHALSVTTGADVLPPAVISASVSTKSGTLQFNPAIQMQRPALLMVNGAIYVGFGSNGCDTYAYNGWLLAYDQTSLQQLAVFVTTPDGSKGAIWQAGGGPAADTDGTIFLATGNGTFDADTGGSDYGDSLLHLRPATGGLTVLDYFTPHNQQNLADNDLDLGSGGVILLPDQDAPHAHELVTGGKEGTLYLVDRDSMGGYNQAGDSQIVQSMPQASAGELDSVPAYWNGNVYIGGQSDYVKAFSLSNDLLSPQPISQTSVVAHTPGSVSISSSGSNNGILWAIPQNSPATLYAFDASNLSTVLYNSSQAGLRDMLGSVPKFVTPTVANGKVYIGGFNALTVYGLLPLISPVAGNNQSADAGTTLPQPLQLQTVDAYQGSPIANASITCKDGGVGGSFGSPMPMLTDIQGQASTTYTLPKKNQSITIICTATGFVTTSFSEIGVAGPVSRAIIVSGNSQTGPVSTQLPAALVMQVVDPYGYGVPGVPVTFSDGGAGGVFSAAQVSTDSTGNASTFYTTPNQPAKVTITGSVVGITPLKFSEVVTAAAADYSLSAAPSSLSVVAGMNASSTITVNPTNGFAASVTLTASGLPAGITASFNPGSTTTTSTLTLTASSAAAIGRATVTVTGTSGNAMPQSATISLTVNPPPSFTVSAAPNSLTVVQGMTAFSTITVNPANGFAASVSLAASGLPNGVIASFNPTTTTGSSTLTLSASNSATTGASTVTIAGTSGSLTPQSAPINLTVSAPPAPNYSLSAGPPTPPSVNPGASSTALVTVTPENGYSGTVTLSCRISPVVTPAPTCSFGMNNQVAVTSAGASAILTFTGIGPAGTMLRPFSMLYELCLFVPGLVLIGLGRGGSQRKNPLRLLLLGVVCAGLIILPDCGGSGNVGAQGGVRNSGTPGGNYTITITANDANNLTQSNAAPTVTVTVH